MAITAIVILVAAAFIIWENVKESQDAEKERDADRKRNGSIWDD